MNASGPTPQGDDTADDASLSPLPGELGIPNVATASRATVSKKGLLAVGLLVLSLVVVSAFSIHRFAASGKKAGAEDKLLRDKPAAAGTEPRRLEMPLAAASAAETTPRVPAILPTADEQAESIGIRRSGAQPAQGAGPTVVAPQDAPVLLVSTRPVPQAMAGAQHRSTVGNLGQGEQVPPDENAEDGLSATSRNLQTYQRQLQGMLDNLTRTADLASAGSTASAQPPLAALAAPAPTLVGSLQPTGLFGGQLQSSATPRAQAAMLGNRSLILPKGSAFTCALKSRIVSAASGMVGCLVQRNVYSDDGRVLLIERGSHLDGEYRIAAVRPGMVSIPVLWTRIRTPLGVTVDIESPATGPLGESGIDGHVDNRWTERIGAAMLLSLIDDSVKLVIQGQANDRQADTIVLPSTTANTSKLAEKVLDSTINIPPLIYQNQGGIVGIYVARDLDFSSVYELRPTPAGLPRP